MTQYSFRTKTESETIKFTGVWFQTGTETEIVMKSGYYDNTTDSALGTKCNSR